MLKSLSLKIDFDKNRVYGLDILRAFAISIVVITHSVIYLPDIITKVISVTYLDGVSIFFVLSGFLIGRILIKAMDISKPGYKTLFNFWSRRWLRTLPIYFLVFSVILFVYNYPSFHSAPSYKRYFIFSENIFTPMPGFFIEAWSLSVEEWFYLLIPLLTLISIKYCRLSVRRSVLILSIIVILFSTLIRLERYFENIPINNVKFEFLFRMQVITRLDSLMYGVLGALISYFRPAAWQLNKISKLAIGILILVINKIIDDFGHGEIFIFYHTVFYLSLNAIGTLLTLPFLSNYRSGKGLFFKVVTYISLVSYSMYLINLTPVQGFLLPFLNNHLIRSFAGAAATRNIDLLLYFPLTFFGSVYLYKFIEKPFMNLRDKIKLDGLKKNDVVTVKHQG
ncbi:MAG TPA: acyltransferase [Mucilaginibacter sp.]|jgi:peptidoglycan/LPS O-acetylase OafA/YrhL|nr:acyltransferase [Mucilaginibacter sp.]